MMQLTTEPTIAIGEELWELDVSSATWAAVSYPVKWFTKSYGGFLRE